MTRLDQLALAFLALVLLLLSASLPKAPSSLFWILRVIVPELGWVLFLASLPPALWLARNSPKFSFFLLALISLMSLYPWIQALGVARALPSGLERAFSKSSQDRTPLLLGRREFEVEIVTEEYYVPSGYAKGLAWDRYRPRDAKAKACLLFVHGGSWRNGTRQDYPQLFFYLASRGYEVVSLTYRLAPEHPYPSAPDDLQRALEQLVKNRPLFLMGRSSGAHLALLSAYRNPDKVAGVIAFYPPVDMNWSYQHPSNPAVLNSREALAQFLGGTPLEKSEIYREASPLRIVEGKAPPTLLIHGQRDCLVYIQQSRMLADRLLKLQVPRYLVELPWAEHGGDVTIYGPTGVLSSYAIESFIEARLSRQ